MRAASATGPPAKRRRWVQLKLRRVRRLVVAAQRRRISSPANSRSTARGSPELGGRISTCSINAPFETMERGGDGEAELRSGSEKSGEYSEATVCNYLEECSRERETTTPSSSQFGDLESTADKKIATRWARGVMMPALSEIEEFFASAESAEKRRFIDKYNFDVDRDVPLDGRYEWVRLEA